eukprot:scaffold1884_cov343-Ochromonas_danica.AAC.55
MLTFMLSQQVSSGTALRTLSWPAWHCCGNTNSKVRLKGSWLFKRLVLGLVCLKERLASITERHDLAYQDNNYANMRMT